MFQRAVLSFLFRLGELRQRISLQTEEMITDGEESTYSRLGMLLILRGLHPHSDYLWPDSRQLQTVWLELLWHTDVISLTVPGAHR